MSDFDNTPILIGVGQSNQRGETDPNKLMSAVDLAAIAAANALDDARASAPLNEHIDVVTSIRLFEHSTRKVAIVSNPLGQTNNVPGSVAKHLKIRNAKLIYAPVGGQTPQRLVNEMCERIHSGEVGMALIAGAEAIANIKAAVRNGLELDWHETIDDDYEERWPEDNADKMVSDYEIAHGLFLPVQAYPLFEHTYRAQVGKSIEQYRGLMSELFADFTEVAADNPHAQFPTKRSADFLSTPSKENYLLSEPYTKWFVAQDAVNQGAAVLLTSAGKAKQLGIDESRWVYLHSYADVDDVNVVERPNLAVSHAQNLAVKHTLAATNKTADDIDHLDIYSCFPIAVLSACDALGIEPLSRRLTLTGGLPFFGGPGNNYSMHAIAEVVQRTRHQPSSFGLVIANGGYLSKHSVGIYSTKPTENWLPFDSSNLQRELNEHERAPVTEVANGEASIETYVAAYHKGKPAVGYVFGRLSENNTRIIATVAPGDEQSLNQLFDSDPMGRKILVSNNGTTNQFSFLRA